MHHRLPNCNYENDARYTFQICKCILGFIGLWPISEKRSCLLHLLKILQNVVCCFFLCMLLVPNTLYLFLVVDSVKVQLKAAAGFCFYTMASTTYCVFVFQQDRIRECMKHVEEDWRNVGNINDRKIMLNQARIGRAIVWWATFFLFASALTYRLIQPIVKAKTVVDGNVTVRPLMNGFYFVFFDAAKSPAYEIVLPIQSLAAVVIYTILASVCAVTALFTVHACGQLQIMASWLENPQPPRKFATIISHHVRIQRFLHCTQDIVGEMCFVEIIGCTLMLCLLGYNAIVGWEQSDSFTGMVYAIVLISFTFNIFMLCYIGELLSMQGNKLNTICCTINWYRLPSKEARHLILLIAMTNYPFKLTANKLIDLSFGSFGAVIKTALAYLNLLRTVTV